MKMLMVVICIISIQKIVAISNKTFPPYFKFGVATASYQIEGSWKEDGKGENIWDHTCHTYPNFIDNQDNGDITCDSYHKYAEDVSMVKNLGVDFYRFSLSWSRILPTGYAKNVNQAGIEYYRKLIDLLVENDIEPVVTIYHWDLPQPLQDIGGWTNPELENIFADYAKVAFEKFGDSVKTWITFNEPKQTCQQGYGDGTMAPGIKLSGTDEYVCAHTLIKAHARTWHLYNDEFKGKQNGRVSITIDTTWKEPVDPNNPADVEAAERGLQFVYGWYANPIYKKNYPQVMIDRIAARSIKEGYNTSRLPKFTDEEIKYISGTYDYMGLNVYTSEYARWLPEAPIGNVSYWKDLNVELSQDPNWKKSASSWLTVTPWGIRKLLNWLKETYNDPEIIITENGFSDKGDLNDQLRIDYYKEYLSNLLDAVVDDGVNVTGYTAWTLMDNFEWARGYAEKFGLYHVDFQSTNRIRKPKASATYYSHVIKTRCIIDTCEEATKD